MRRLLVATTLMLIVLPEHSAAWHAKGHMSTALVAYQLLHDDVKDRVQSLLRKNPSFSEWQNRLQGVPASEKPPLLFAMAATWPDDIKNDRNYTHDGNRPSGPKSAQNIGYRDHLQHRYWHFVDRPFSDDGTALESPPIVNALERIELFRTTIGSSANDSIKSYDLVWLEHLVGDVHQPLHCTSRFSSTFHHGDTGGNDVKLSCNGCGSELHGYWDGIVGETKSARVSAAFAKALADAPSGPANDINVEHWVAESFDFARSTVYVKPPIGAGAGPFSIAMSSTYRTSAVDLGDKQIALGGARLAKLINDNLR